VIQRFLAIGIALGAADLGFLELSLVSGLLGFYPRFDPTFKGSLQQLIQKFVGIISFNIHFNIGSEVFSLSPMGL
jgi:hypothetical protein